MNVTTSFHAQYSAWSFYDNVGYSLRRRVCLAGLLANCDTTGTLEPMMKTQGTESESAIVDNMLVVVENP